MIGELLYFGVVLVVIPSQWPFTHSSVGPKSMSMYDEMPLDLFKAMLGELSAFYMFTSSSYGDLATFLMVTYLVIMAVMLLNPLIAVLSTTHENVNENAEREPSFFCTPDGVRLLQFLIYYTEGRSNCPTYHRDRRLCDVSLAWTVAWSEIPCFLDRGLNLCGI